MKNTEILSVIIFCIVLSACKGKPVYGQKYLAQQKIITLPGVNGRIDHMDVNLKDQVVYAAALGNNSVEVADLKSGKVIHSIKGLDEPQGIAYIPQLHEIIVANGGNGVCTFYDAGTFQQKASIKLSSDADDVRYDSTEMKVYVGYGKGGIAIIDANSHKQTGDIKLPAHPEGFQLDKGINRLFVNVPDANSIAVIDLQKQQVTDRWKNTGGDNFPMALDPGSHRIYIGYRKPAELRVIDGKTGRVIYAGPAVEDMDDLYFDPATGFIFISGGAGYINMYKQKSDHYEQVANLSVRKGARTSLLIPSLRLFVLAERAEGNKDAQLVVYKISGE